MSTNGNGNPTTKNNEQPGVTTTLTLTITWDQVTGQCTLGGQIVNKVVAYGMLDMAKEIVKNHCDAQAQNGSGIIIPAPNLRM